MQVSSPGFQSLTIPDIDVAVDQRGRVDATLQPGAVTEQVTVSAGAAPLLATDSNAIGTVVDTRSIRTLPLNGRRFFDLALLSAGAAPARHHLLFGGLGAGHGSFAGGHARH